MATFWSPGPLLGGIWQPKGNRANSGHHFYSTFGGFGEPLGTPLDPFWQKKTFLSWEKGLPLALFWSPLAPYWLRFESFLGPSGHAWALFSHFCNLLALMLSSYDQCSLNFLENQSFIYVPTYFTSRNRFHKAPPFRATFDAHAKDNSSEKLQGPSVQIWVGGIAKRKQLRVRVR